MVDFSESQKNFGLEKEKSGKINPIYYQIIGLGSMLPIFYLGIGFST